ncbi:hypothetical protein J7E87_27985 [Streptomyces sp. ISL-1]|uniref:hypothetical protein n=1 Tax=Streptomyces sp. ISL-1 TaxID=2817657 RepID=UPI001BE65A83|nr:hypothetical protein [Streptomyces sp. ISL-1]MBT2393164.1 hypothetical protein [Streptomyces sp. ISL-1]
MTSSIAPTLDRHRIASGFLDAFEAGVDRRGAAGALWPYRALHGWVSTGVQYGEPLMTA